MVCYSQYKLCLWHRAMTLIVLKDKQVITIKVLGFILHHWHYKGFYLCTNLVVRNTK